jgi:excisionase family DNA binding protein
MEGCRDGIKAGQSSGSDDLGAAVASALRRADPDELPVLIGTLEAGKAAAWARLMSTPPNEAALGSRDHNLSAREAAARLGVSKDYVYRHANRFPFTVRIGRRLLFDARRLEQWNRSRAKR